MCTMQRLGLVVIAFAACLLGELVGRVDCDPWNLFSFNLCKKVKLERIRDNASGVAYNPTTGTLWVITNHPAELLEYSVAGELRRTVPWSGFHDPEGLAWISDNRLAIVEEPTHGGITIVDVRPGVERVSESRTRVDVEVQSNGGLEGVTYDPENGNYFVVQERTPKRVLEVFSDGVYKELFKADHMGVGDLSGIHYSPEIRQFFILSQESNRVLRVTKNGWVLQGVHVEGNRPEGVAMTPDGNTMFIASEPNELTVYSNSCVGA